MSHIVKHQQKLKAVLFFIITSVILVLSLVPRLPDPVIKLSWIDKLEHFAAYAAFAASLYSILPNRKLKGKVFTILAVSLIFGGGIEYLQQFTGRSPDVFDLFADLIGAAAGAFIYICVTKSREI